ncbi:hypothetical protein ACFX13_034693 [Malus domestica]
MALPTADLLIGKIVTIFENEASSVASVRDEIDDIKQELVSMRAFLHDADRKKAQAEGEATWVASVRDLAYDVEDIIDEFMYHMYEQGSREGRFTRWVQNRAESSLFIMEDELLGIDSKKQELMDWLVNGDQEHMVVSVVGMGGSGKTTLVAKAFNDERVKRHFNCCAWITVSKTYVIEDLFRSLIKEFHQGRMEEVPADINSMTYRELLQVLINYLESKRFVVVLDDVWDKKLWEEIKTSLQNRRLGSRIILTTRNEDVASYSYGLESLAWDLVEKCEGLPLALVALGDLMSSKNSSEWIKVYNSLNWHLTNHPLLEPVKSILLLSFDDLPYRRVVEHVKGITLEEVAEGYLMELIFRGMLHVVWRNETGRPKACKMHDLMRELALSISEREKFCVVYDGIEVMEEVRARRLSTQTTEGKIKFCTGMSQLRSFLVFVTDTASLSFSNTLPSGFKLLRVLDLEYVPIDILPKEVVYLFNLRYLNLRATPIKKLPESIGKLHNLQTLDIRNTKIEALPSGISKLKNLCHLIMYRYTREHKGFRYVNGTRAPANICTFKKLQVLTCVELEGNIVRLVGNMTQLTRIGITNVKERDEKDLCASIQKMKLLHYLFLMASDKEEALQVNALRSPPPYLRMVILVGRLKKVPQWFFSLQSVTYMYLHWSRPEEDLLPYIEELPNLGKLTLMNAYVGKELCFRSGFEKLTHLQLFIFPLLNMITIAKGVMPNLQSLSLDDCTELNTLPEGLQYLTKLETLRLELVPEQLVDSI